MFIIQIVKHYSKKGVQAKEVLPLFPDFDVGLRSVVYYTNLLSLLCLSYGSFPLHKSCLILILRLLEKQSQRE